MLERSPVRFRRKLSEAGYVAAVEADEAELQVAMVVESTPSGTALLGSSRQHVGFDREVEMPVAAAIARRAARFFPVLRDARALRVYAGLRPLTPDHVPIVGPFRDAPNVCVATGHEGAGIGLAPATGELVAAWYTGAPPPLPLAWFSPDRFAAGGARRVVIELTVDGAAVQAPAGQSLAAALLAAGRAALRTSPQGTPRGRLLRDRRLPGVPRARRGPRHRARLPHPGRRRDARDDRRPLGLVHQHRERDRPQRRAGR